MTKRFTLAVTIISIIAVLAVMPAFAQDEFVFGMVLVGPENDGGWSQAHYDAGLYVQENIPGTRMVFFPSLNTADAPETTLLDVVTELVDQGAQIVFTASDAFEEDTDAVALAFPDVVFINISGDNALTGQSPANVGNLMSQMEWGKLIAGCAAGLATNTGSVGYLGPLVNGETRRLVSSTYLGAQYCYEAYNELSADVDLTFTTTWIGFWFNIPGVTLDPTEETNRFFDSGADVVISGIDTREAIVIAGQRAANGEDVHALPYDHEGACESAPEVCLGVPYFHWGPDYARVINSVIDGTWTPSWEWTEPDWSDLNNPDTSPIGFVFGDGLSDDELANLNTFIADLAEFATNPFTPDGFALWIGPLNLQDGTELAPAGQLVEPLDVWYLGQLLEGIVGSSN